MEDIFEKVREAYENGQTCLWNVPQESKLEEKLQYLILQQRYKNLDVFLIKQQEKYGIDEQGMEELKELLFYYNDLKELNFIGTDLYANALFFKHKVPYLYRSVGKDTDKDRIFGNEHIEYAEHTKTIFRACLKQIETGGKGQLFSYSKCFGKMLYKYATLQNSNSTIVIEVRKDAVVNAISENGKDFVSIQKYIRKCTRKNGESGLPYFAVDMSNARDNSVDCLKYWITEFLGEQIWHQYKHIVSPVGDAEVVCNFTNTPQCGNTEVDDGVKRFVFHQDEFCVLLYKYFRKYAGENSDKDKCKFEKFIAATLNTLQGYQNGDLKRYYERIIADDLQVQNMKEINDILDTIVWENEKKYMSRRKGEIQKCEPYPMEVYKGNYAEAISKQWKYILFSAIEAKYSHIDYSGWK